MHRSFRPSDFRWRDVPLLALGLVGLALLIAGLAALVSGDTGYKSLLGAGILCLAVTTLSWAFFGVGEGDRKP